MLKHNNYLFLMERFCVQMVELSCIVHIPSSIFGEYIFWGGWGGGWGSFPFFHVLSVAFTCTVIYHLIFGLSTFSFF